MGCRCKTIPDETRTAPKTLQTITVDGPNGCTKKVCRCPPAQTANQCDADQEIVSTTSVTCGTVNKGECKSKSTWDELSNKYGKNCSCCSVASYEDKIISLKNKTTGATKDHTLKVPVLCSCAVTKCQNDEL